MKKRKNIFFYFALTTFSFLSLQAQEKGTNELKITYGTASINEITNFFTKVPVSIFQVETTNERSIGVINASYKHAFIKNAFFGVNVTYEQSKRDFIEHNTKAFLSKETEHVFTTALESDYHYISNKNFQMYSGLGLGYTAKLVRYDDEQKFTNADHGYVSFHINALGIRYGKKLAATAELGFGYKGILNAGLNYQF